MIVKVVPGRRDGKTDIKQLAQYITQGTVSYTHLTLPTTPYV